jgi:hypothetical protein
MTTLTRSLSLKLRERINSLVRYEKKNAEEASGKKGAVTNQCDELKEKRLVIEGEHQNKRREFLKNL